MARAETRIHADAEGTGMTRRMRTNQEFYEGTIFEGKVPWVEIGLPVRNEHAASAWDAALDQAISQQLAEMGTSTEGELFEVTDALRKTCADSRSPIPRDVIEIVRWKRTDEESGENALTLHKLTARDSDELHHRCLSLLLDALVNEEAQPDGQETATIVQLRAEWRSRAKTWGGKPQ